MISLINIIEHFLFIDFIFLVASAATFYIKKNYLFSKINTVYDDYHTCNFTPSIVNWFDKTV